jgi:GNAT superfamily N-acetyltransferase
MDLRITPLSEVPNSERSLWIEGAKRVFVETLSGDQAATPEGRALLESRYFTPYLEDPAHFWLSLHGSRTYGYLAGTPKSDTKHYALNPYLVPFQPLIQGAFPAHLHINLTSASRGSGIGSLLIQSFEKQLISEGIQGLHVITTDQARNVSFYLKNGFVKIENRSGLLFLGKALSG